MAKWFLSDLACVTIDPYIQREGSSLSIGSWQPAPAAATEINQQLLDELLQFTQQQTESTTWINDHLAKWQALAYAEKAAWLKACTELTATELEQLIRFFTVLEHEQNWDLGERSPVIPLFKTHKKANGLDKALVQ